MKWLQRFGRLILAAAISLFIPQIGLSQAPATVNERPSGEVLGPRRSFADLFAPAGFGPTRGGGYQSNAVAASTGGGSSGAMGADVLLIPGLLTASQTDSAVPLDRIFFEFGYFNEFRTEDGTGTKTSLDVGRYNLGLEKTFLDQCASILVRVPFLDAVDNIATNGQLIDGLGGVTAGIKGAVFRDDQTGDTLSAGFLVTAPPGRNQRLTDGRLQGDESLDPAFLQPFAAGFVTSGRWFVQEYFSLIIPTDDRVSTILNTNFVVGYTVYQSDSDCCCQSRKALSFVSATFGVQVLLPVSSTRVSSVTRSASQDSDQVFLSGGLNVGLRKSVVVSAAVLTPVAGPRLYDVGATLAINYLF